MSTDIEPASSVRRFGVEYVGKPYEWAYENDGDVVVREFRAVSNIGFSETLDWTLRASKQDRLLRTSQVKAIDLRNRIARLAQALTDDNLNETLEQIDALNEELTEETIQRERDIWAIQLELVLSLIRPSDRDQMQPLLENGNPKHVRELLDKLTKDVIGGVAADVAEVEQVDPTLQKLPAGGSDDPPSGPDSEQPG